MNKIKYSIADTFGVNVPKSAKVTGLDQSEETNAGYFLEPNYKFRKDLLRDVLAWWEFSSKGDGLFLTGPTGSGKSSLILQIAARLNWPIYQVTAHEHMEFPDLLGRMVINPDGSMSFQHGSLPKAYKYGGLFLLDEEDMLPPGGSVGFNGVIQGEPLTIPENGGEVIYPHPDFRFAATGNTSGNGDYGLYLGTSRQNIAFMDRFWTIEVDYMDAETEKALLKACTSHDDDKIDKFIEVANEVRKLHMQEESDVEVPLSTRVLIRWAQIVQFFYAVSSDNKSPLHYALDRARLFSVEPKTREAIHEIVQRVFGE